MLTNMLKRCKNGIRWIKAAVDKWDAMSIKDANVPLQKKSACYEQESLINKVLKFNNPFTPTPNIFRNSIIHHHFNLNSLFDLQHFSITKFITPSHKILLPHQFKDELNAQIQCGFSSKKSSSKTIDQVSKKIDELVKKERYDEIIKLMDRWKVKKLNLKKVEVLRDLVFSNLNLKDDIFDFADLAIFCLTLQRKDKLMEKSGISQEDIEDFLQKQLSDYLRKKKNINMTNEIEHNFKKDEWQFAISKDYKLTLFRQQHHQQLLYFFYKVNQNGLVRYIVKKNENTKSRKQ